MSRYDQTAPAGDRKDLIKAWLVGVTLAVAGGVSLVHLVAEYRAATPWREARAAEYAREREAADARRDAERRPPAPAVDAYDLTAPGEDVVVTAPRVLSAEERRIIEAFKRRERQVERSPVSRPVSWAVRPSWPGVPDSAFPSGVSRIEVQFRCQVDRQGKLTRCTSSENPTGSGLAARMRPAIEQARLNPMMVDGRPVESQATFGVSFSARPQEPVPPRNTPVPASEAPTGALPPADSQDRSSVPAPQPVEPVPPKPAPEA